MADPSEILAGALEGNSAAVRSLVNALTPVIQHRVARSLLRRARSEPRRRDPRGELEDLTQDVLVSLFEDKGRILRSWDKNRGLSLLNFVGLVAERQTAAILRSGRRSAWAEDPTLAEDLEDSGDLAPTPEVLVGDRELVRALMEEVRIRLSPFSLHLFYQIFVEERPIEVVCKETGMQRGAIDQWKTRTRRLLRSWAAELEREGADGGAHERGSGDGRNRP